MAGLVIVCGALTACLSDDAALRAAKEKSQDCSNYRVDSSTPDPATQDNRRRYEQRNRDNPYYGPPPYTPVDPSNPVPRVSCIPAQ